jgi:hypothetical protein
VYEERKREKYVERESEKAIRRERQREQYVERESERAKVHWTTGSGREKSGEIENSERKRERKRR